jgi:hypothetical protein
MVMSRKSNETVLSGAYARICKGSTFSPLRALRALVPVNIRHFDTVCLISEFLFPGGLVSFA